MIQEHLVCFRVGRGPGVRSAADMKSDSFLYWDGDKKQRVQEAMCNKDPDSPSPLVYV